MCVGGEGRGEKAGMAENSWCVCGAGGGGGSRHSLKIAGESEGGNEWRLPWFW